MSEIRQFESGAKRDADTGKYDFEGFLSPEVLYEFAAYMHEKRHLPNGQFRDADNWQKGFPIDVHVKSFVRHTMDLWLWQRSRETRENHRVAVERARPEDGHIPDIKDTLGALLFAVQGIWLELIKEDDEFRASQPEPRGIDGGHLSLSELVGEPPPSPRMRHRDERLGVVEATATDGAVR